MFVNSYCGEDGKVLLEQEISVFFRTPRKIGSGVSLLISDVTINNILYSFAYYHGRFMFLSSDLPEIVSPPQAGGLSCFERNGLLFTMNKDGLLFVSSLDK